MIISITTGSALCVFSQNAEPEKPQITDFGKSLKKGKEEKDKPQTNQANGENQNENDVIKVDTSLVRTDVLVVDQRGQAITGLKSNDFIVSENDVPQEIGTFSLGDNAEVPRSIVLIIDYSGSQVPYLQTSIEAAKVLVDKLNPKDRMAVVTDDVELLVPFTKDKNLLKKNLDSLAAPFKYNGDIFKGKHVKFGKSLQYSALMATLNELFDSEDVRPIIIFQTDGDEALFISSVARNYKGTTKFTIEDLFGKIEKSRVTIYSVVSGLCLLGLTPDEQLKKTEKIVNQWAVGRFSKNASSELIKRESERIYAQQKSMEIVARASGGFTEKLETPDQADDIYSRILNDINYRYLIGYYPSNQEHDGKRRNVKIEVRGHPEYIIWGRKSYFAPQDKKSEGN